MADEYITREDAIEACKNAGYGAGLARAYIEKLPAADVRPVVRGRWVNVAEARVATAGDCSVCGEEALWWTGREPYPFCPNCNADMREIEGMR